MQFKSMVVSNVELSPNYFRMRMTAPQELLASAPGQFLMLKVTDAIDPLLRRPFGLFDVGTFTAEYAGCGAQTYCEILYKVVGKGTKLLAALHHGDVVDLLAPLGRGFDLGPAGEEKVLVGGGVGLAPLYYLAKALVERGEKVRLFAGGRNRDDILCITEFERLGVETYVATDDGTLGESGFVTQVLERHLNKGMRIFACGPTPMLDAVAKMSARHEVPCQVSMEAYMACGVGACLGCVMKGANHTEATPDYRCVCKDGPVFDSFDLQWS
ncbi:Dihydroorotate dehydrogenase (NAD(+)), electron transfer subunit [Citrifermentans bremense]|uniref:Dihydroorotate dehydrogenase B (NAD(+)), electron transfer subunit n=1 Tax=Citrifermentans bremense TaxID=60035 RepID=A0A6S6LZG5_9BACT|nr:dihydroorotate dehydrogenase electron transfer subunit [Citrifermentans bremense]BCG47497.1 Dihydroorotate dehydrogenase (NAD(+)), electron transfer subunit [Citrifermentans bremense]